MSESIGETERPENEVPLETTTASEHVEEENPAAGTSEAEEKDAPLAGSDGEQQQEEADTEPPEPPKKKSKTSRGGKKGKAVEINIDPDDKYPYARLRGIRIFSDREIEAQDAQMTREYWRFWNDTAEELCSNRAYNDWGKRDLKLYIDAAWIIHKTYLQENVERELAESLKELQEKCGYNELPHKLKNQDESVTTCLSKLQDSTANLHELNLDLAKFRGKFMNLKQRPTGKEFPDQQKDEETRKMAKQLNEHERNLYDGMTEVKRDQDSLRKALNRLKTLVFKARQSSPVQPVS